MIEGDSIEYQILQEACETLGDNLLTAEIGVRQGKGSLTILDSLKDKNHWHIGIDPYGNLKYEHYDNSGEYTCDYTNSMRLNLIKDMHYENFTLFPMGDDEFMRRFYDGVPIYRDKKEIINKYDLVHFDGPHKTIDVMKEVIFFGERSHKGTVFVFDDYPKFNMDLILKVIVNEFGFMLLKQGKNKISLKRN
jgi:hypothetical protein|tara:strand:- start:12 stop:587 length:576 start_codon:yes stop_codon:yes gene_type:complete